MLGIFCATKVTSDEEYRRYARRRCLAYAVLAVVGVVTAAIALAAEFWWTVEINDMMLGVYAGVGAGLTLAGIVLLVKNIALLKDDKKLRKARIEGADERNIQISMLATRAALAVLLIAMYFTILIGGLWYPILTRALTFLLVLFVFAYVVASSVISRRI